MFRLRNFLALEAKIGLVTRVTQAAMPSSVKLNLETARLLFETTLERVLPL